MSIPCIENEHPKFTIAIPAYKAKYLSECIDSIISQTYKDFELIIVNDASPEDIDSIIYSYSDHRIRYYKNEKGYGAINLAKNWNKCLQLSQGLFFVCMGDDDKLAPNLLEQYNSLINKYPTLDVYHARLRIIDENSSEHRIHYSDRRKEYEDAFCFMSNRFKGRLQYVGDFLFRKTVLEEKGGFVDFPCAWFSDEITAVKMVGEKGIANTSEIGFEYRISNFTITSNSNLTQYKVIASRQAAKWYIDYIKNLKCINDSQRSLLLQIAENRMRKSINSLISYDVSFGVVSGIMRWYNEINALQLARIIVHGLRMKISRLYYHYIH